MRTVLPILVLLVTGSAHAAFHPASRPDLAFPDRWMVLISLPTSSPPGASISLPTSSPPGASISLPTSSSPGASINPGAPLERLLSPKARVERRWSSALNGFLATMPEADARRLAEQPGVLGVFQDLRLDTAWSAPIPDCSLGVDLAGPLPSTNPQSLTCADPDPQSLTATCTDNWGLDRLDGPTVTRDGVYAPPRTGAGVHLFIVDTGLYAQHQDFQGRVGLGHDATGLVGNTDDCSSWSHGTHVAGIAAGTRYGVAKGATLHSVRVAPCPLNIALSSLVSAFDWIALAHGTSVPGPAVASMSINSSVAEFHDATQPLGLAISGVLNAGVLVIESAGNQAASACDWATSVPGVLIVGGADELDTPWERRAGDPNYSAWCPPDCGSNTGACVSLFAPAAHIVSAWLGASADPRNSCRLSGTSMAAPHAAGVAALYLQANPTASPAQVKQALIARALPVMTQLPSGSPNALLTVLEGTPALALTPTGPLDFGGVGVGSSSAPRRVTLTSTGTLAVSVGTLSLGGAQPGDFTLVDGCSGQSLAVGAMCTVDVTFRPAAPGVRAAVLSVPSSAGSSSVTLGGTGSATSLAVSRGGLGAGRVVSAPAGVDCGATCNASFTDGAMVTLTATPDDGAVFGGWSGLFGCDLAPTCTFVISGPTQVTATFDPYVDAGVDSGVDAGAPDAGPAHHGVDAGTLEPEADGGVRLRGESVSGSCGCSSGGLAWLAVVLLLIRRARAV